MMEYAAMVILDLDVIVEGGEVKTNEGIEKIIEEKVRRVLENRGGIKMKVVRVKLLGLSGEMS